MYVINSPIGKLGVLVHNSRVIKISFLSPRTSLGGSRNPAISRIAKALQQYFYNFRSPSLKRLIKVHGTPLQQKIWRAIQKIPFGQTRTYGTIASQIGTNPRIVGNACRANALPLLIPCHRVVAAHGLGGYGGKNKRLLIIKHWLLQHEHKNSLFHTS